jgi:hypothetical protein
MDLKNKRTGEQYEMNDAGNGFLQRSYYLLYNSTISCSLIFSGTLSLSG